MLQMVGANRSNFASVTDTRKLTMKFGMNKFALTIAAIAMAGSALAVNDDATFGVSATVASECVVGNTTNMAFGNLAMLDSDIGGLSTAKNNATATFDAACTNGTGAPTLQFASANGGGTAFSLKNAGTDMIAYTLYEGADDTGTLIAHNAAAAFTGFSADGAVQSLSVTGQVLDTAKNGKPKGAYADTVTITVGFTAD